MISSGLRVSSQPPHFARKTCVGLSLGVSAHPSARAAHKARHSKSAAKSRDVKSVPSASADGSRRKKSEPPAVAGGLNSRVRIVKKPRDQETIEAEIMDLEKKLAELSDEMSKPEVARDITRLVAVNDDYQGTQLRLAELYDEWERSERAVVSTKRK